jgi:uncharacterized membrane protein
MDLVAIVRWLHVLGAAVLFGTGVGLAFFMVMAHRSGQPALVAHVAGTVVIADSLFTATAVVLQPVTGFWLAQTIGWPLTEGWIVLSLALYVFAGLFWVPVVWIQMRLRDLARAAAAGDEPLPESYTRLFRIWYASGFPAFGAVLAIYWLMLAKPAIRVF